MQLQQAAAYCNVFYSHAGMLVLFQHTSSDHNRTTFQLKLPDKSLISASSLGNVNHAPPELPADI
jgi:hypothetical protein